MRPIEEIIVHCSATRPEWMQGQTLWAKRQEIKRWHVEGNGWKDIGYHWLIDRDGQTVAGRPVEHVGAHVRGHNTGTIGVCLIGGHGSSEKDQFPEHFTPAQDKALRGMIAGLRKQFPAIAKVSGHNEYAAKACPGFNVRDWLLQKPATAPVDPPRADRGFARNRAALTGALERTAVYASVLGGVAVLSVAVLALKAGLWWALGGRHADGWQRAVAGTLASFAFALLVGYATRGLIAMP